MVCCGYRECVLLINVSSTKLGFSLRNGGSVLLFQAANPKLHTLTGYHINNQVWLRYIRPCFVKTQVFRYDYNKPHKI